MAYDLKRVALFGATGVIIAALIITSITVTPSVILPAVSSPKWYTEIEATFYVHNPEIEEESLVVRHRMARGAFLHIKPSVKVSEGERMTPRSGVVNFTTLITVLDADGRTLWSSVSHLAGFGRKHFLITLFEDLLTPGETYTVRFTTTLRITPFRERPKTPFGSPPTPHVVIEVTRTFERTFTLLDRPSLRRLQEYVEKPGESLDEDYYYWLLHTLYEEKGSYFMDAALNTTSREEAFQYVYTEIEYERDVDLYGQREYFAKASETLARGAGDCEDKSILLASTLYWNNLDRGARVVVGEVLGKGHAWVEVGDWVYDPTNNIVLPKSDYYSYVTALYFYFTYDSFELMRDAEGAVGR